MPAVTNANNTALDLVDRASYLSSTAIKQQDGGEHYKDAKTPVELEGGALRAGGAPTLLSKESLGLLVQYAAVGVIYGTLPSTIYPFMTNYLNMEGQQTTSADTLVSICWCLSWPKRSSPVRRNCPSVSTP